ncbi:MAG: N-acetylmuramoyl-L-alanine amidase [Verrucomicrobiota bacterium]
MDAVLLVGSIPLKTSDDVCTVRGDMRRWHGIMLVVAAFFWAAPVLFSQTTLGKLERVEMFGNTYVSMRDWAELIKMDFKWTRKDEEITMTSKWSKFVFTVDSRQSQINGVAVSLSVPIARRNGGAYIAPLDVVSAINPVINPPRNPKGKVKTICLDPGHGGKDPGNQEGRLQEKKYTLLLAEELKSKLEDAGFKVVLTRSDDSFTELGSRPEYARKRGADLLVSLHFNAAADKGVTGVETYCMTPPHASSTNARGEGAANGAYEGNRYDDRNMWLAWNVQKSVTKALGTDDRGVRRARFAVLRHSEIPAILVEGGFMTSSDDGKKIYDRAWRAKLAQGILEGIQAYKKGLDR